jgi:uncharacterized protein (UPF0262 family)
MSAKSKHCLIAVDLDGSIAPGLTPDAEHERRIAIYDLIEENHFKVAGHDCGPYRLRLSTAEGRLIFDVKAKDGSAVTIIGLSMSPFRRIVKDYFLICESYYKAIRHASPSQIETIDMARRALHNEGSEVLKKRLDGKVHLDSDTARRLFTLICVLYWRH